MNIDYILLLIAIVYGVVAFSLIYLDRKINRDVFSAVKIITYFALIEFTVMFWFSLRNDSLFNIVLSDVPYRYQDINNVRGAYLLSVLAYIVAVIGAFVTSYNFNKLPLAIDFFIVKSRKVGSRNTFVFGFLILIIGLIFYIIFLYKIGGLAFLWGNLEKRTTLSAGLGYYQIIYTALTLIGGLLVSTKFMKQRSWIRFTLLLSYVVFIFGSLGARYNVALFIFILLLIANYQVKPIKGLLNIWIVTATISLLLFMLVFVQFREKESIDHMVDNLEFSPLFTKIENDVIKRFGVIERQVVVIGYFNQHDYWYGASYLGLIEAYKPRSYFSDKPPVDTGVYLRALSNSEQITPPVPMRELQATSWPEGNLAGYMNFGVFGFVLFSLISGLILGMFYHLVLLSPKAIGSVIFYGIIGFMGAPDISPYGIFKLLEYVFIFFVLGLLSSIKSGSSINGYKIKRES